jgi:hypothetical protein
MKKILFVIAKYNDGRQKIFDEIISPRNKHYCDKHGFKYVEIKNETQLTLFRNNPTWWKFTIVKDLIDSNKVTDGDIIAHIDADMYFVKDDVSIETPKSFSYSIDSGNTHCMGWYSLKINEWTKNLVKNILSDERFNRLNDKVTIHDRFKTYSSFWHDFREQASWYSLAGIKRHSDKPFWEYPNNGFYSQYDENVIYTIDELKENVEIFKTSFNVTEWVGESSCEFNINNNVKKEDVVIRHFAGGQDWNNVRNWIQ